MNKDQIIQRLRDLPEEIAIAQSEIAECEQEINKIRDRLIWLQINLEKRQNEFKALQAIAKLTD